ncbi:archease [Candidatus Dependentiae bacterium]|nr:archease [Candidatus Dependentiae bacterium]
MKKFNLIDHTADVRLFVQADSQQELFLAALQGMAEIISPTSCHTNKSMITHIIKINSHDPTVLLIDFLSEALTLSHVYKALFCSATFTILTPNQLEALVHGIPVAQFDEDIKAVTYHEAEIIHDNQGNLSTMIVFDI